MGNDGEFVNDHFISLCDNVNIHICTTKAEIPWGNWLIKQYNVTLGYTVAKAMEDCKTDLSIALSWAVSAKNSLKNVNNFSPN